MDKFLYVAMSGAKQNMDALAVRANNLANVKTTGFKADLEQARSMQAFGEGLPTRVFAMTESPASNFDGGAIMTTGRNLDVAIEGDGWLAVEAVDGTEAYTRNGELRISPTGLLETASGHMVMGDAGPIVVPLPVQKLEIGRDGTVTILPQGAPANAIEDLDRIRLVNPEIQNLTKRNDGLYTTKDGSEPFVDAGVTLLSGALETSNVNAVEEMTSMLSLQRKFEMQVKMMKQAEEIDQASSSLMRIF